MEIIQLINIFKCGWTWDGMDDFPKSETRFPIQHLRQCSIGHQLQVIINWSGRLEYDWTLCISFTELFLYTLDHVSDWIWRNIFGQSTDDEEMRFSLLLPVYLLNDNQQEIPSKFNHLSRIIGSLISGGGGLCFKRDHLLFNEKGFNSKNPRRLVIDLFHVNGVFGGSNRSLHILSTIQPSTTQSQSIMLFKHSHSQ